MRLSELLEGVHPVRTAGPLDAEVADLACDSRRASPGTLFFALPGAATDGNRFVRDAVAAGATAVVSQNPPPPAPFGLAGPGDARPVAWVQVADALEAMSRVAARRFGRPSASLTTVGVTGTNGKTTATYFLESIFSAAGGRCGVLGTVNVRLDGRELASAANTTPPAIDLQRHLRGMLDGGATHVAMEVSSHALALKRADDVDFDAAVFTNLHRDHLDYHGTRERYLEAKARLFEILCRASNPKRRRAAVLNADDPASEALRRRVVDAEVLTYGLSEGAGLRGEGVRTTPEATELRWRRGGGSPRPVRLKLIGRHNAANALAAAAAGLWLGIPEERVAAGLEALELVPGRLEPVRAGQPFGVFVDYAHTDSALENVLATLGELPHRRIITVFGCGGDRDRTKRGPMGAAACRGGDLAVVTSDNPRSEDPARIFADIEEGPRAAGLQNYRIVPDRREAIALAVGSAQAGDLVLIAGKGHETTQTLKDRTVRFDDREESLAAIRALGRA